MQRIDVVADREHARLNRVQTLSLLAALTAIVSTVAYALWGWIGLVAAVVAVGLVFLLSPRVPADAVMRMYRAEPVTRANGPRLVELAATLGQRAGLPAPPTLHVIPSLTLNAFASGSRDRSAIAVTEGLMRRLSMRELAGVLAHETAHIANNDLAVLGLADLLSRLTQSLPYVALLFAAGNLLGFVFGDQIVSWWVVLLLYTAPLMMSLLQLALSRTREFAADHHAARLTGDPEGLAAALRRLEPTTGRIWEDLTMPVPGRRVLEPSLLRTHPPTAERIARLSDLAGNDAFPRIDVQEAPMISIIALGPSDLQPRHRFPGIWY
jgi:heat shock protein HtpX